MTKIKMMTLAVLALALSIALPALAQDTGQPSTQANPTTGQQQSDQSGSQPLQPPATSQPAPTQPNQAVGSAGSGTNAQTLQGPQTLSGTISADGKTFNSNGNSYVISHPNSVKPFAGQPVSVAYEADTNNSIHISKVMLTPPHP